MYPQNAGLSDADFAPEPGVFGAGDDAGVSDADFGGDIGNDTGGDGDWT